MMEVVIKETGVRDTLSIIDPKSKIDYVGDFIGNWGATSDGQFTFSYDLDAYECDQETYEWWLRILSEIQDLEERIVELKEQHGSDVVTNVIGFSGDDCDLEDLAGIINRVLDEAFGETN